MILSKEQYEALPEHLQKHIRPVTDWVGFKTALKPAAEPIVMARKPAHEPIVMARKPHKGSTIDNVLKNGLGAMNIDATRVPWADTESGETVIRQENGQEMFHNMSAENITKKKKSDKEQRLAVAQKPSPTAGRDNMFQIDKREGYEHLPSEDDLKAIGVGRYPSNVIGEVTEGYQKFFYNSKVSRKERHCGFDIGYRLSDNVDAKIVDQIKDLLK